MAKNSNIEWTHHTFNPWRGCTKVSQGCKFCYAETLSKRNPGTLGVWGPKGARVIAAESYWRQPLAWDKAAAKAGERHRVFCASLADVFEGEETMPASEWPKVVAARNRLFDVIEQTPNLDWLLLTKRPENIAHFATWPAEWPANVWIGTSVEDQAVADERIPHLLRVPARVRFLSCEPLLGPVDLHRAEVHASDAIDSEWRDNRRGSPLVNILGNPEDDEAPGIHWVIAGGESGGNARPMHPEWVRSLRDQCVAAGVAFHFKQWGEWLGFERVMDDDGHGQYQAADGRRIYAIDLMHHAHEVHGDVGIVCLGKKAAGRMLGGRTWDELPA